MDQHEIRGSDYKDKQSSFLHLMIVEVDRMVTPLTLADRQFKPLQEINTVQ